MTDLVVVLPGIMGSVLARDGREVWNHTLAVVGRHALGRLDEVRRLALPADTGDADPGDGVEAVGLIEGLHVLPGVSAIDGYGPLMSFLRRRLGLSAESGNLLPFPYDWRLSVRLTARRLAARVEPALAAWRARSGNPEARVVFVAHSMGGLVARYYLDVLGGSAYARALITIGTPYRGSVNALETLYHGVAPGLGRLSGPFTRLARSMPSLHQLLPSWRCLADEKGVRSALGAAPLPGVDGHLGADAVRFHEELDRASGDGYALHVFGGYRQPTRQSALWAADGLRGRRDLDGTDHTGDGTVPRFSCFPAQSADDTQVRFFAQRHGALHNERALLNQLEALLTARDPRRFLDGGQELGVDLPEVAVGGHCPVDVVTDDDRLVLSATAEDVETGRVGARRPLRNRGDGHYGTRLTLPGPGAWRVTVADPANPGRVHAVSGIVLAGEP
ncbi:esterase/lipase family protein [Streptomyces sp. enrichment culture]|uniref:esterase/lipase family protein n=1 Tax=Streptomyces sp. enrichment culture TaxID=1795815 RepID=UPI003F55BBAD